MKKLILIPIAILIAYSGVAQTYVLDSVYAISNDSSLMDAQAFIAVSASDTGYAQPTLNGQPAGNPILLTGSVTGLYNLPGILFDDLSGNTTYEASLDVYYFDIDTVTGDTAIVLDQSVDTLMFTTLLDPQLGEITSHDSLPSMFGSVNARIYFVCGNHPTAIIIRHGDLPGSFTSTDTVMVTGQGHFDYTLNGVLSGATKYFKVESFNALGFSLEPYYFQLTGLSQSDPFLTMVSVAPGAFGPDSLQSMVGFDNGTSPAVYLNVVLLDEDSLVLENQSAGPFYSPDVIAFIFSDGLPYPGDLQRYLAVEVIDSASFAFDSDTVDFFSEIYPEPTVDEPVLEIFYFEEIPGDSVRIGLHLDPKGNEVDLEMGVVNEGTVVDDFQENRPATFQVDTVWLNFGSYETCFAVQAQAKVDIPTGAFNSVVAANSLAQTIIIDEVACTSSVEEEFWRNFQITQNYVILPSNLSQGTIVLTDMSGRIVEEQQTITGRVAFSKLVTKGTYIVTFVAEENEYVFSQSFGLGHY